MIGSLTYVTNEVFLNDDFIHLEILKVGWLNFYIYKLVHIRNSAVLISFFKSINRLNETHWYPKNGSILVGLSLKCWT